MAPTKAFCLTLMLFVFPSFGFCQNSPWHLYTAGDIEGARKGYEEAVSKAKTPHAKWQANMGAAWFEHEVGDYRKGIEYSNAALEVAQALKDDFRTGRTLSWLGYAYANMGFYHLAIEFYKEAVKLGTKNGKIVHVPLWGLSTQELGNIHFKMGDAEKAKELLYETTKYARDRGIKVGVSEGGAHIARILLAEGKLGDAKEIADEAVKASFECGCSPANTSRALTVQAKIYWELGKNNSEIREDALKKINEALNHAVTNSNQRYIAELKLLLSETLDSSQFDRRYELVSSAYEILASQESEKAGDAEAEMGKLFLNSDLDLAKFYLERGYEVNRELFRKQANSHILTSLAELDDLSGEAERALNTLEEAAKQARETNNLLLAFKNETDLSVKYAELGYYRISLWWGERAYELAEQLLANETDQSAAQALKNKQLDLMEALLESGITLGDLEDTPPSGV